MAAPSECHASQDEGDKKIPPKILPLEDVNDTWDPMEDDFKDPNFNHYTHGPAKYAPHSKVQASFPRRLGPGMEKYSEVYRVFIRNVPDDLNEDGITMLVTQVSAKPVNVYKKREDVPTGKPAWAVVEFAKHSDAKKTIESLHNAPPMKLNVQFGFSDEEKARHARERAERRRCEDEELARKIREPVNEMLSTIPDAKPIGMDKFPGEDSRDKVHKVGGRGLPLNPPCRLTSWPQEPRAGGLSQHAAATVNLNDCHDPLHETTELDYFGQYAGGYNDDATAVISKTVDKLQRDYHPVNSRSRNFGGRGYYMPCRASERKPGGLRHSAGRAYNPVQHTGLSNPKREAPWERPRKLEYVGPNGGTGPCGECHRETSLRCIRCNTWFCSEACLDVSGGLHPLKCPVCDLVDPYWKANFVNRGAGSENRSAPQQQQQQQANGHQDQPPGPEYIEPNYGAGRGLPKQPESVLNPNSANFKPSSSSQTLVDPSLPRVKQTLSKPSFLAHKSQNPSDTLSTKAIPEPTLPKPESNKLEEPPETKSTETPDTTVKPGIIKTHSQNLKPSFNKKGDIPQQGGKGGKSKGRSRSKGHSTPSPKENSRTNTPEPRSKERKGVNSNNLIACGKEDQEEGSKSEQKSFSEGCSPGARGVNSFNLITCSETSTPQESQVPPPTQSTPELPQCDKKPEMPPWPNVPSVNHKPPHKVSNVAQNDSSSRPKSSQSKPLDSTQQVEAKSTTQQLEVQTQLVESKNQSVPPKPTAAENEPAAEQSQPVSEQNKSPKVIETKQVSPNPAKSQTAPVQAKPVPVQNSPQQTTAVQGQSDVGEKQTKTVQDKAKPVQPPQSEHAKQLTSKSPQKQTEEPQSEPKGLQQAAPKQANTAGAKSLPSSPKPSGKTFASSVKNQATPTPHSFRMPLGPHNAAPFNPSLPNPNKSWASTLKSQPESKPPQTKANCGNLEQANFPPPRPIQQQPSPQQVQTSPPRDQPVIRTSDFSIPPPNMSPKPPTPNIPPHPHTMSPNNVAHSPMTRGNAVQQMAQCSTVQSPMSQPNTMSSPISQGNNIHNQMAPNNTVQSPIPQGNNIHNQIGPHNIPQNPLAQRNTVQSPIPQGNNIHNQIGPHNIPQNPIVPLNSVLNTMANNTVQKQMGPGNAPHNQMRPGNAPYNPGNGMHNQMGPGNITQNYMGPGNPMHNNMGPCNPVHVNMVPAGTIIHNPMGPGNPMHSNMGPGNLAQNPMGPGNPMRSNMGPGNAMHNQVGPVDVPQNQMGPGNIVYGPHNHMNPMQQQHMAQVQQIQAVATQHMQQQVPPNYAVPYRSPSASPHKQTVPMHHRGRGACQQQINFQRDQSEEKIPNIPPFPADFQNPEYYTQRRSRGPRYPQQRSNWRSNYQNKQWQSKPRRNYDRNPTPPINTDSARNPTPPNNTDSASENTTWQQQQNRLPETASAPATPISTASLPISDQSNQAIPVPQTSPTTSLPMSDNQSNQAIPVPQISPTTSLPMSDKNQSNQAIPVPQISPTAPVTTQPDQTKAQPNRSATKPMQAVETKEPVLPEKEVNTEVPEAKTEETKDDLSIRKLLESIATSNPKASSSEKPDIPELSSVEASMVANQLREEETEVQGSSAVQADNSAHMPVQFSAVQAEASDNSAHKPVQSSAVQNPEAPKKVKEEVAASTSEVEVENEQASSVQENANEQKNLNVVDTKSYEKPPRHQNPPSNQQHRYRQARHRNYAYPEQQQMYPPVCLVPVTQQPAMTYPEYNFVMMSPVPPEAEYPSASGTPDFDASNFYPVEEYYDPQYYYPQASPEQEYYASESEASSTEQYVPANIPHYTTMTSPPMYYPSPSPEFGNEYPEQEGAAYMEPVYPVQYSVPNHQVVYMTPGYAPKEPEQQYAQYPAQLMYPPGFPQQQMVPVVPQYYNTMYQPPMMLPPPSPSPQAYAPQMSSPQPYVPQISSPSFVPQAYATQMQGQQNFVPQNPPAFVPAQPQYRILPRPPGAGIVLPPHLVPEKPMQ